MKKLRLVVGILLGLIFVVVGLNHFLNFFHLPQFQGAAEEFYTALEGSSYLLIVKIFEILGGILVAIPRTRNVGLVILGPIIANILFFKIFLQKHGAILDPVFLAILVLLTILLICGGAKRLLTALLYHPDAAAPVEPATKS